MELLQLHLQRIKVPTQHDKVHKDECVYSFDNPVCTKNFGSEVNMQ